MDDQDNGKITTEWRDLLDDRQRNEVKFAQLYSADFHHGTDGHNRLMLISALVDMLDTYARHIEKLQNETP